MIDHGELAKRVFARRDEYIKAKKQRNKKISVVASALAVAVTLTAVTLTNRSPGDEPLPVKVSSPFVAAAADYPETEKYPSFDTMTQTEYDEIKKEWARTTEKKKSELGSVPAGAEEFFKTAVTELMTKEGGSNVVISPTNIYIALGMLADCASGETREQILSLLGEDDVSSCRAAASAVWNAVYTDDGITRCVLADSLWMRDDTPYNGELVKTLAEKYFASSFVGEMGSDDYNDMLRRWIAEQTGKDIENYSGEEKLSPDTVLALVSTIHFVSDWSEGFNVAMTKKEVFHGTSDAECDFMHGTAECVYFGDGFTAVDKHFRNNEYKMTFILPDEGVTLDELLKNDSVLDFITHTDHSVWANADEIILNVPKFDVDSKLDLIPGLEHLGVTDAFVPGTADFSPVSDEADSPYVSDVSHAARFYINEEGCEGAAYTRVVMRVGAPATFKRFELTLDRPFIFVVRGVDDLPLFVGVVCDVN